VRLVGLSGNRQMRLISKQDLGAMNFIDKSLDVHARALDVRSRRMEVLAAPPTDVGGMRYRIPFNVAFDGNTVELNIEQPQYGKAAADYQATLQFLEQRVSSIRKARKGE